MEATPAIYLSEDKLNALTVVRLKELCRTLGLPVTGKKAELIAVLTDQLLSAGKANSHWSHGPTNNQTIKKRLFVVSFSMSRDARRGTQ